MYAQDFCLAIVLDSYDNVPKLYTEATSPNNIDFWSAAIKKEEDAILENRTFQLVTCQSIMHVLPCRYVFRINYSGSKARIVARGFRQIQGIDYQKLMLPLFGFQLFVVFLRSFPTLSLIRWML